MRPPASSPICRQARRSLGPARQARETAGRRRPVTPVAPAPQAKPVPAAATVSNETTGSIDRPKLHGYWLVEADEGYAVIDGRDGPQQVAAGDVLPGIGRVQRIERRGRDWVVVTSAGVIAGDQPAVLTRAADPDDDVDAGDLRSRAAASAIAPARGRNRGCRPARRFPRRGNDGAASRLVSK